MNTITRIAAQVSVATGLAAAALVLNPGSAFAEVPHGPSQFQVGPHVDPQGPQIANPTPAPDPKPGQELPKAPQPKPDPKPQVDGPGDLTDAPHCTHGCGGGHDIPDEPADEPDGQDVPDQGCFSGCDLPEDVTSVAIPSTTVPTRVDAGQGGLLAPGTAADTGEDTGTAFYLGLGMFSLAGAAGVALAARRLARV